MTSPEKTRNVPTQGRGRPTPRASVSAVLGGAVGIGWEDCDTKVQAEGVAVSLSLPICKMGKLGLTPRMPGRWPVMWNMKRCRAGAADIWG